MAQKRLPASPASDEFDNIPLVEDEVSDETEEEVVETKNFSNIPEDNIPADPTQLTDAQLEKELARRTAAKKAEQDAMLEEYKKLGDKEYTRKLLETQEQVPVFIPFDLGEGVRRDRSGRLVRPIAIVGINGVSYEIPKGLQVNVPLHIAERVKSSIESEGIPQTTYGYDLATSPDKDVRNVTD